MTNHVLRELGLGDEKELVRMSVVELNRALKTRGIEKGTATYTFIKQRRRALQNRKYSSDCRDRISKRKADLEREIIELEALNAQLSVELGEIVKDKERLANIVIEEIERTAIILYALVRYGHFMLPGESLLFCSFDRD